MPMPLDQWIREIRPHLDKIEAGADICLRHVELLLLQPDFRSRAEADLDEVERALQRAIHIIHRARLAYRDKEVDR